MLDGWLADRGDDWCARIRLATLDPAAGYRRAFEERLPNVTLVVDHFHAVRLANRAIDDIRRRVQQETLGHRGRKGDPLYRIRRVLLTADERLTEDRFAWMRAMLDAGDPNGEVAAAWIAKELLRDACRALQEHLQRAAATAGADETAAAALNAIDTYVREEVGTERSPTKPLLKARRRFAQAEQECEKAVDDHRDWLALEEAFVELQTEAAQARRSLRTAEAHRARDVIDQLADRLNEARDLAARHPLPPPGLRGTDDLDSAVGR